MISALLLTGGGTVAIGLFPTYAQVGVAAPVLLVTLRLLQGLGLGGEWASAALMAVEHAPARRGYFGSYCQLGIPAGIILANLAFFGVSAATSDAQPRRAPLATSRSVRTREEIV